MYVWTISNRFITKIFYWDMAVFENGHFQQKVAILSQNAKKLRGMNKNPSLILKYVLDHFESFAIQNKISQNFRFWHSQFLASALGLQKAKCEEKQFIQRHEIFFDFFYFEISFIQFLFYVIVVVVDSRTVYANLEHKPNSQKYNAVHEYCLVTYLVTETPRYPIISVHNISVQRKLGPTTLWCNAPRERSDLLQWELSTPSISQYLNYVQRKLRTTTAGHIKECVQWHIVATTTK